MENRVHDHDQNHHIGWQMIFILVFSSVFFTSLAAAFPPGISLLSCDRNGAILEFNLPEYNLHELVYDDHTFSDLAIPGWGKLMDAEGKPALPQAGVLIAMPPGARAALSVEILESKTIPLKNPLPTPTLTADLRGQNLQERYSPDPASYHNNTLYPEQWVTLGDAVWLRNFWAIPVRVTPVRVRTGQGDALIVVKLRIRLNFDGGSQGKYIPDPFGESLAKSEILNFAAARTWQGDPPNPTRTTASQDWGQYKLLVEKDGIYQITYSDLQAAGINNPAELDPTKLKIYLKGVQIPIYVEGEGDHTFDPQDYILFWGQSPRGTFTYYYTYSTTNVYWLDLGVGGAAGSRLSTRAATPSGTVPQAQYFKSTKHIEVDTLYEKFGFAPATDLVDQWMWKNLDANYPPDFTYLLNLPHQPLNAQENRSFDLKISFRGYTYNDGIDPDHHVTVKWNNFTAINAVWNDQEAIAPEVSIPATEIAYPPNMNEITIHPEVMPGIFANAFYLDYIRVGYWRDYTLDGDTLLFQSPQDLAPGQIRYTLKGIHDSTEAELWNLTRLERLSPFNYTDNTITFQDSASDTTYYFIALPGGLLTPQILPDQSSDWKSATHDRVDYLIITHEDFLNALNPLISLYQSKGLNVACAKIGDVYDEFSFGLKNPQAIFDFIQYAYYNYTAPHLTWVLLVGDASWDYRDEDALPYEDYCPTHSFRSYKWGETASDNYFVAVSGTDPSPDCYIGRFPVNNLDEINLLVLKSKLYSEAPPGYWKSQVIFSNGALGDSDAIYFDNAVQTLDSTFFPAWYEPPRVYSHPSTGNEQFLGGSAELINYINQGAALVNYMGHAGNQMWTTLNQNEITQLNNGSKMPLVTGYSCFTGIFSNTTGFGEAFVRQPDGGAVAYWSNAGIGYLYSNWFINYYLFQQLFADSISHPTFGEATTQAKWTYYTYHGNVSYILTTFVLFGDPGAAFAYETPNPADTADVVPPQITLQFPNINFRSGDFIQNPVNFTCDIFDSTGLDSTTLNFQLSYEQDSQGNPQDSIITWDWQQGWQSLPSGFLPPDTLGHVIEFNDNLSSGEWKFSIAMADFFGNGPTRLITDFRVAFNKLVLEQPLNYPNPFSRDGTTFTYILSQEAEVTIKIFTVSGKLIKTISESSGIVGYNMVTWDGKDAQEDPLSNGVYLYKIIAKNGFQQVEQVQKMIKMQ